MFIGKTQSNRKLTKLQYLFSRSSYLPEERRFWMESGIALRRPTDYDDPSKTYDEIWNGVQYIKVDASRIFNIDEVPWTIDFQSSTISAKGEHITVQSETLKQLGKYRQGSLVMCSNAFEVLFVLIIFRVESGGANLMPIMREWNGNLGGRVLWTVSSSGNMVKATWKITLKIFMLLTTKHRGCLRLDGTDYTHIVALYVDNYQTHTETTIAETYARLYGAHIRPLTSNASHHQQPIDQHVGYTLKRLVVKQVELWACQLDRMNSLGAGLVLTPTKWKQALISFTINGVNKLNSGIYDRMLCSAWINFGLYLPLDGSRDDDYGTLHVDGDRHRGDDEYTQRLTEMLESVTIHRRPIGQFDTQRQVDVAQIRQLGVDFDMHKICRNSSRTRVDADIELAMLQLDLTEKYAAEVNRYSLLFAQDLTHQTLDLDSLGPIVTAHEVLALKYVYDRFGHGQHDSEWLFTKCLNIPVRDMNGYVEVYPDVLGMYLTSIPAYHQFIIRSMQMNSNMRLKKKMIWIRFLPICHTLRSNTTLTNYHKIKLIDWS